VSALTRAYRKALTNGWTTETVDEETAGPNAWNCYKAIMNGLSFAEYREIISTGGDVRYIPHDDEGF
jgi:hypothetical protein